MTDERTNRLAAGQLDGRQFADLLDGPGLLEGRCASLCARSFAGVQEERDALTWPDDLIMLAGWRLALKDTDSDVILQEVLQIALGWLVYSQHDFFTTFLRLVAAFDLLGFPSGKFFVHESLRC